MLTTSSVGKDVLEMELSHSAGRKVKWHNFLVEQSEDT